MTVLYQTAASGAAIMSRTCPGVCVCLLVINRCSQSNRPNRPTVRAHVTQRAPSPPPALRAAAHRGRVERLLEFFFFHSEMAEL